ncbi:COX assembly mitochondrial protein [Sugiyamaella lignohabitans]|uniref:COX assembly mitochondrial protein n=1 Tax=Sugiyamaella lignohabitans TaxID=796027 RepID=A0A167EDN6_9ASCO|nr:COX assembly mitochondrial protein [Sugiyamaella lignohabitans]ANB13941.1 COX assembly mitochondrial protein [Sugiyamaella lignohabitans]
MSSTPATAHTNLSSETSSTTATSASSGRKVPAWMLAPYEEKEVRARCQEQADRMCADKFLAFGRCSEKNQLLFSWKCAEQKKAMIDCVAYWGSTEKFEEVQDRYITEKQEKLRKEGRL